MPPSGRAMSGHSVFEVHLVKTGELLGIEVLLLEPSDNFLFASGLVVERVSEDGLAGTWNRWSNESSQIRAGDIIFKVNEVEEDSEALFNELQSQMELHISIMRPNCSAWSHGKGSTPTIPAPPQQPPPPLYQQQQVALAPPMERPTPAGGSFQPLHMERPQSQATSQQLEQLNQQYQQQVAQLQQMYWQQEQQLHQQWMNHLQQHLHQQYIQQMQSLQQQWEQDQLHIMNQMPSSFQSVRPSTVLGAEISASSGRGSSSGGFAGGMSAGGGPSGFSARASLPTAGAGALGAGAPSGVGTGAVGGSAPVAAGDPSPAAPGAHVDLTYAVRNSTLASYMKHSFTAFVKRESLGLGVTVRAGTLGDVASFLVSQIRPGGALSVWNASCPPSSVIHEGDAVIGINGISLDLNNMAEEVRVCQEMRLTVLPRTAWPGLGILDDRTSSTGAAPHAGGAPLAPNAAGAPLAPHAEDLPFPGTLHGTPGTPGGFIAEGRPLAAAAASRN